MKSTRAGPGPSRPSNDLLAALPQEVLKRLGPSLEVVPLKLKHVIHRPGEPIHHVYFPGEGFFSILTVLADGQMVEVATVGREGVLGVPAVLDGSVSNAVTMVQAEMDTCYKMPADTFRGEMARRQEFYTIISRYLQAIVGFIMQSTACNAVHSIEQRLARWLLLAQDRIGRDEFPLTQEFVAMMLGASRPTVTIAAGTLQKAGLITYHRGHVTIVNREKLEAVSCECYRTTTEIMGRVTRPPPPRGRA